MAVCEKCGRESVGGDKFCRSCGAPLGSPPPLPPPSPPVEETLRERAEKHVTDKMELLQHAGSYLIVNAFLIAVWALTGAGYPWFLWVMAAWGVGLAFHVFSYLAGGSRGAAARERMVTEEMERMRARGERGEGT